MSRLTPFDEEGECYLAMDAKRIFQLLTLTFLILTSACQTLSSKGEKSMDELPTRASEVGQSSIQAEPTPVPPTQIPGAAKTSISQIDSVINAILSNDLDERLALVRFASAGCTTADGLGSTPRCEEGQAEGTPVEFLPLGGPGEGSSVLAASAAGVLEFEAEALYAAYIVAEGLPDDPSYPHGTYALIFSTSGTESDSESIVLRVDDEGYIVRLDHLGLFPVDSWLRQKTADLIDPPPPIGMFSSEAAEILVYPPDTTLPVDLLSRSLKGYTLQSYTWDGQWYFTLTAGLNAVQPCEGEGASLSQDIPSYTMQGVEALKAALDQLQPGEYVTWCESGRPEAEVVEDVITQSEQIGIHLDG